MFLFREFTLDIKKEIRASLIKIFGVGWYKAYLLTIRLGLGVPFYLTNLNTYFFSILFYLLKGMVLSNTRLKRILSSNISLLVDLSSYRGLRHKCGLPLHGQRTRTNARTQRSLNIYKRLLNSGSKYN